VRTLEIVGSGPLGAMDCVEVAPAYDPSGHTAHVGARVVVDVLALQALRIRDGAPTEAVATEA
jgi:arginase family enzyme